MRFIIHLVKEIQTKQIKIIYLIIARSFSKACGLAGARIGYLISNKNNINYISNSRSGYETNSLIIIFAETILDNNSIVKDYVNETKKGIKIGKA